jgi:phosphate transport system permease protein
MGATPTLPAGRPSGGRSRTRTRAKDSSTTWSLVDRIGLVACWVAGISLTLVCGAIVLFMLVKGIQFVRPSLIFSHPVATLDQSKSGGFFDPLIGTLILTAIGIAIALPLGVGIAVWLTEYGRPAGLARLVESGIEVVAGTPSIVLAIFGLAIFQEQLFAFLSFKAQGNAVFGRSFFTAGIMMSLIALPLVVASTREALRAIPNHVREASYALGKTKAATIRRVLLPGVRPGIATGATLGMGRIAGDTAIVILLLGGSSLDSQGNIPILGALRGTGSTLTTYVYNNSPAGEGNQPNKAYAAAFVLLLIVVLLNFGLDLLGGRRGRTAWTK